MNMENGKEVRGFSKACIRAVDTEKMQITHTISTINIDRYGTAVVPKGGQMENFLANPVVLWLHNTDNQEVKIPIGRCVNLEVRDKEIVATTEFNKNDPLARRVFDSYKDGFLHAWSIGFMPMKFKQIDEENVEDINQKYGLSVTVDQINDAGFWGLWLIYEWELFEYSAVPVPGNPEALNEKANGEFKRELVRRGLMSDEKDIRFSFKKLLQRDAENAEGTKTVIPEVEEREESAEETTTPEATEETTETPEATEEAEVTETTEDKTEATEEEETTEATEEATDETEAEEETAEETSDEDTTEETEEETEEETTEAEETEEAEEEETEEETEEAEEETEDEEEETETVAEEEDETEENTTEDELRSQVDNLTRENSDLSERLKKAEEAILRMDEALSNNNVDKVRKIKQKRLEENNPDTFFSQLLKNSR